MPFEINKKGVLEKYIPVCEIKTFKTEDGEAKVKVYYNSRKRC